MEIANKKSSEIISLINGKNILLTGATGYVGKLLVEQLLRKCNPNKLYLLIRPKNNVESAERMKELFNHVIYERLKKKKPNFFDKVELLSGDISKDNLGLSEESKQKLIENVNFVIHGAATVKFNETLKMATNINVKGTLSICKLCHQMKYLKAFVHVSTAYCNCPYKDINEVFYESPIDCDELLLLAESLNEEDLDILTNKIIGKWPNTYTFTKAVAEDVIRKHGQGLPVSIFRPAMILPTNSEPIPGWIDNMYGPVGLSVAVYYGILKVIPTNPENFGEIVPGDMVASAIIATLFKTSKPKIIKDIKIFNFVTDKENPITWRNFSNEGLNVSKEMPIEKAFLPPSLVYAENPVIVNALIFFLHFLPVILLDIGLLIRNKKLRGYKVLKLIRGFYNMFGYFSLNSWNFTNDNMIELCNSLNETDRKLFYFDMKSLNWKNYVFNMIKGIRIYLIKEMPVNIPRALKKYKRQIFIKNTLLFIGFAVLMSKVMLVALY